MEQPHIDFDKTNSDFENLLLYKRGTTHRTRFADTSKGWRQKREYIAIGKMTKIAIMYGRVSPYWSAEAQAYFYHIVNNQGRRFVSSA